MPRNILVLSLMLAFGFVGARRTNFPDGISYEKTAYPAYSQLQNN